MSQSLTAGWGDDFISSPQVAPAQADLGVTQNAVRKCDAMAHHVITRIGQSDLAAMRRMNALFAEVFEDAETYLGAAPDDGYLHAWLSKPHVIVLAAFDGDTLIGGLVAYVLDKFEQARSEVYIYDLAVRETHRREGVATALIVALKPIAQAAGALVIFVQADYVDPPAIALYEKLGMREEVLHFDIPVHDAPSASV